MIRRRHIVVAALLLAAGVAHAGNGKAITASYGAVTIAVPTTIGSATSTTGVALVGAAMRTGAPSQFGIVYAGAKAAKEPVLELRDASGTMLRTVSVGDLLGRSSAGWKVTSGSNAAPGAATTRYAFSAGGAQYTLGWSVAPAKDEHLPTGKAIAMTFTLTCDRAVGVRVRFLGSAAGAFTDEATGCFITDSASGQAVVVAAGHNANVRPAEAGPGFEIESQVVNLLPRSAATLLALTITGTTAVLPAQAETQARNVLAYARSGAVKPELVAVTTIDRASTSPGDTVTYTIEYCNIGTAPGTGIEIRNAIPGGARYVEDTAAGAGSTIDVIRSNERVAQSIEWRFQEPILPGERRTVRFKVIVS